VADLEQLKILAERGPAERKRYLDALEETYGDKLKVGNASGRRLLTELAMTHGGKPRTPLAKEFYQRLLPMLPEHDRQLFLDEMLRDMKVSTYQRLDEQRSWWKRLW
jgi:hypothetical protein